MQHSTGKPVAKCYLSTLNDDNNVCQLYSNNLVIIQRGKKHTFNLETLLEINSKHKKLLFPLVTGGITATFFLIASFNFSINIWVSLSLSCIGFIAFYLGWQGTSTLTITTPVKEYDFFLYQISRPLSFFIQFINEYIIQDNKSNIFFYLPYALEEWKLALAKGEITIHQKTYLYSSQQIALHNIKSFLKIDANGLTNQIMIDTEHSSLTIAPFIQDSMNISAVEMINL